MSASSPPSNFRGNLKRKDPPSLDDTAAMQTSIAAAAAPIKKVTPPKGNGNSPYHTRMDLLEEYRASANGDYVFLPLVKNILERIPNKFDELDIEDMDDLSEAEKHEAIGKLTLEEVDKHFHQILAREEMVDHINGFVAEINNAEPRETQVVGVVWKQLYRVQTVLNKAIKVVKNNTNGPNSIVPGVARDAFEMTYGAIYACDVVEHRRRSEVCNAIVKKISKLLKDLLWFHDEELGFIDPFSRKSFINRLETMRSDWKSFEWIEEEVTFFNRKNEKGMGRRLDAPAPTAPAAKKPKTVDRSVAGGEGGNDSSGIVAHLNALGERLSLRANTTVQLKIADSSGKKSCKVVCSGSISLKKVGQLVAFLTEHASDYEQHINRGKSLKGSYFELSLDGKNKLWLGDNALKKKAGAAGIGHVIDKPIKIVQVFQGLTVGATKGMVFDSESNKEVSLVWISDKGDRYSVTAQGILPNKCVQKVCSAGLPMPRVVDDDNENARKKTGFGKSIRRTNTILRGDRKASRGGIYWDGPSAAEAKKRDAANLAKPLCSEYGHVKLYDFYREENVFSPENIRMAGAPSSMVALRLRPRDVSD